MQLLASEVSADYYNNYTSTYSSWNYKSFNAYNYIHTGSGLSYTFTGQIPRPYSMQLEQDPGHGTGVMGVTKIGNTVPRAGFEPIYLTFRPSVLTLHHIGFPDVTAIPTPTCLCSSLPQSRGQCRLLHMSPWNYKSFNAYNYIHSGNGLTYTCIDRVGLTTIQYTACTGSWSWNQCHGCDKNWKYCA